MPFGEHRVVRVPFDEVIGVVCVAVGKFEGDAQSAARRVFGEVRFKEPLVGGEVVVAGQLAVLVERGRHFRFRAVVARFLDRHSVYEIVAVGGDGGRTHVDGGILDADLLAEEELPDLAVDDKGGRDVVADVVVLVDEFKALPVEGADLEDRVRLFRVRLEGERSDGRIRGRRGVLRVISADVFEGTRLQHIRFGRADGYDEVAVPDRVFRFAQFDADIAHIRLGDDAVYPFHAVDGNGNAAFRGREHDLVDRLARLAHAHLRRFQRDGEIGEVRIFEPDLQREILCRAGVRHRRVLRVGERIPFEGHVFAQHDGIPAVLIARRICEIARDAVGIFFVARGGPAQRREDAGGGYVALCSRAQAEADAQCRHAQRERDKQ